MPEGTEIITMDCFLQVQKVYATFLLSISEKKDENASFSFELVGCRLHQNVILLTESHRWKLSKMKKMLNYIFIIARDLPFLGLCAAA